MTTARYSCLEARKLIRVKNGFSRDITEIDLTAKKVSVVGQMKHGKDLRNKIALVEDRIFVMGGSNHVCESYNYIDKKWTPLKTYSKNVKDNLDSWTCFSYTNFPDISSNGFPINDYLSDYYSNDFHQMNYQLEHSSDDDFYDNLDINSELTISENSFL